MERDPAAALDERRRTEFRRMVVLSAFVHLGALGVAVSSPAPRAFAPPAVIAVELVADPTRPSKPTRASRESVPAPPKPPPKPVPAKTVLPAKPSLPKPKPATETPKPKPRREEVVIDPTRKQEKSLEDLLADFRDEQGEPEPAPPPPATVTAAVPSPGAPGGTAQVSPEVADWVRRAKLHVKRAWVVPPGFRTETLTTHVVVKLDVQGNVVGTPEIARRSGNPWYDEGVVRGIQKASPLPPPPEAGDWDFVFVPEDSF